MYGGVYPPAFALCIQKMDEMAAQVKQHGVINDTHILVRSCRKLGHGKQNKQKHGTA